jgi:uncharacterized protein YdaU (DUF1376 family)
MHYYPKNIGDYRRDTMNLSLLEHGVYTTLIDHYTLNEEPFPLDHLDVCWTIGARTDNEKTAVCLILTKFFIKTDEGYRHKRCDEEISKYQAKSEKAKESVGKRWNKDTNVIRTYNEGNTNQEPITNNQEPLTNNHIELFEEFWEAYPHRNGKRTKKQSLVWWKKQPLDTLTNVLSNTKKYVKYLEQCKKDSVWIANPPDPIRYLNNEQYNDEFNVKSSVLDRLAIGNILAKADNNFYTKSKEEQSSLINNYINENV